MEPIHEVFMELGKLKDRIDALPRGGETNGVLAERLEKMERRIAQAFSMMASQTLRLNKLEMQKLPVSEGEDFGDRPDVVKVDVGWDASRQAIWDRLYEVSEEVSGGDATRRKMFARKATKALWDSGYQSIDQIGIISDRALMRIPGLGKKGMALVRIAFPLSQRA